MINLEEGLTVLSCFDGMGCGRIALERAGLKVKAYYASEIDKPAMKVAKHNWPDIIHIGDVTKVRYADGWLYTENGNFYIGRIDLLIGGSPCQGFSFAGKQLNFEDPRSKLFFEFVRLRRESACEYFMLENVMMKKEHQQVISEHLFVEPKFINSELLSAQHRKRLYWSNIPFFQMPVDKELCILDIVQNDIKAELSEKEMAYMLRSSEKWSGGKTRINIYNNPLNGKALCLTANMYKGVPYGVIRKPPVLTRVGTAEDIKGHDYNRRIYHAEGKSPSLAAASGGNLEPKIALNASEYRKLTAIECERLQTVPDNYTSQVSNSQRLKMLGNGWTVDVITHLFEPLNYADIL